MSKVYRRVLSNFERGETEEGLPRIWQPGEIIELPNERVAEQMAGVGRVDWAHINKDGSYITAAEGHIEGNHPEGEKVMPVEEDEFGL